MEKVSLKADIMKKAIQSEIKAKDFYSKVSSKIKNKKGRRRMLTLSKEESSHRNILERRYKKLFGEDFVLDPAIQVSEIFRWKEEEISSQATALEVVSIGIQGENDSIQFYKKQFENVNDAEDLKILKKLIKFEESHKIRLQKMYGRLSKVYY